jgi:hypothetical protein
MAGEGMDREDRRRGGKVEVEVEVGKKRDFLSTESALPPNGISLLFGI